jgi:hypothetical protein
MSKLIIFTDFPSFSKTSKNRPVLPAFLVAFHQSPAIYCKFGESQKNLFIKISCPRKLFEKK